MWVTTRVELVLCSTWKTVPSHGCQISNPLLLYPHMKQATSCVCCSILQRNLIKKLGLPQEEPTKISVYNKSAIAFAKKPVFHNRSKHIDTRYYYIRECIRRKGIQLEYVKAHDQVADIFTKLLKK